MTAMERMGLVLKPRSLTSLLITVVVEFALVVFPTIIAFTHTEYTVPLVAATYASAVTLNVLSRRLSSAAFLKQARKEKANLLIDKEVAVLTSLRGQVMLSM